MTITFTDIKCTIKGSGSKKRLSIVGVFFDHAKKMTRIYNLNAIENAIGDRWRKELDTEGLEYGHDRIRQEYTRHGMKAPESPQDRRRRVKRFIRG